MRRRENSSSMRGPSRARLAAIGTIIMALYLLLPGVLSGAATTLPQALVTVDPRPHSITLGANINFSTVLFGDSVDSTTGAGGSDKSTNNSLVITNTGSDITVLTVDYTGTPGANCGSTATDWEPDSDNDEGTLATDRFVMYASLANDLSTKQVIPASGSASTGLTITGTWDNSVLPTRDLDLQLFTPSVVTGGLESCTIAFTITVSAP